jgi:ethylmalonyl-CoA/methylmalonyl-CoA decarboxylase
MTSPNTTTPDELIALRQEFRTMGTGRFDLVRDDESGIAVLTINNFEKRNSLSGYMMSQMDDVLTELECWSQVCL